MKNRWNGSQAAAMVDDPLALRVYSSRLLGEESALVLHGGGNTSVKTTENNLFGEPEDLLWVKGSGWDLATIEKGGFAPVKLDLLRRMASLASLSDSDMVKHQRAAMVDPAAPNPSVEAILHAMIPFRFVDHTHADAVVTICHAPDGEARIRQIYGDTMLVIPYVMPGFDLAKLVRTLTKDLDWSQLEGMILLQHGVFTFSDDAETSYSRMIAVVSRAEDYLAEHTQPMARLMNAPEVDLLQLAAIRGAVAKVRGGGCITRLDTSAEAIAFAARADVAAITARGPLTPDHIIRTKQRPVVLADAWRDQLGGFVADYQVYFARNRHGHTMLNPAPCWGIWQGVGTLAFGGDVQGANIIADISRHTMCAIDAAEKLGGWHALSEADLFAVEYWELEQAKLAKGGDKPELSGRIALVTGAASGIGRAAVLALKSAGCVVAALDIDAAGLAQWSDDAAILPLPCDLTDSAQISQAVAACVRQFGGLDMVISNAGVFPASSRIEAMDDALWQQSLNLNLTAQMQLLRIASPFLKLGIAPAVVINGSKNVPAPGPGAGAYSVAKAGLTQLARVAALELGADGVRVNTVHPNAVFDTAIWSDEVLQARAAHYGMTVDAYKCNNVLKKEVTSHDVARMMVAMCSATFAVTTGAQVAIDGGNERVI
ncbi:MAG: bifunctional aldolase/short-chain dehydrogenase [Mariprofundales bacterium]|nr:bifunctional aldolase/short-chain dehydrogenase [Mariprofundales bacterium]